MKWNHQFSSLVTLATFQVLNRDMWPVATAPDREHSGHCRHFRQLVPVWRTQAGNIMSDTF